MPGNCILHISMYGRRYITCIAMHDRWYTMCISKKSVYSLHWKYVI
jgi:hypothetical protein